MCFVCYGLERSRSRNQCCAGGTCLDGSRECRLRLELLQHSLLLLLLELLLHLLQLKLLFLHDDLLLLLHLMGVSLLLEGLGLALQFLHCSLMFQQEGARLLLQNALRLCLDLELLSLCPVVAQLLHMGFLCLPLLLPSRTLRFQLETLFHHLLECVPGWSEAVEHGQGGSRTGTVRVLIPVIDWSKPDPAPADWNDWPNWNGAEGSGGPDGWGADRAGATSCHN